MLRLSMEQLRGPAANGGRIPDDLADAAFSELDRPELWFTGPAAISACGRR
jgi:hypothetical protein